MNVAMRLKAAVCQIHLIVQIIVRLMPFFYTMECIICTAPLLHADVSLCERCEARLSEPGPIEPVPQAGFLALTALTDKWECKIVRLSALALATSRSRRLRVTRCFVEYRCTRCRTVFHRLVVINFEAVVAALFGHEKVCLARAA